MTSAGAEAMITAHRCAWDFKNARSRADHRTQPRAATATPTGQKRQELICGDEPGARLRKNFARPALVSNLEGALRHGEKRAGVPSRTIKKPAASKKEILYAQQQPCPGPPACPHGK